MSPSAECWQSRIHVIDKRPDFSAHQRCRARTRLDAWRLCVAWQPRRDRRARPGQRIDRMTPTAALPNFAKFNKLRFMSTMNISLPAQLKSFVDEQVSQRGYGTSSEYVRELIRKDQDRLQLRSMLMAGAASKPTAPVGEAYFEGLRQRLRAAGKARGQA